MDSKGTFSKHLFPIFFTKPGISIDLNEIQVLKNSSGRSLKLFDNFIDSKFVQFVKASVPIVSTEFGISIEFNLTQFQKTESPIVFKSSGKDIEYK
ncbi:hypothetical protein Barb6XT_00344 [Bacteroidales bacterium Barb6XT]|nr:hypothetical protein Barb6XT_00344 [Bacteroidales bacterium Barb6XT]